MACKAKNCGEQKMTQEKISIVIATRETTEQESLYEMLQQDPRCDVQLVKMGQGIIDHIRKQPAELIFLNTITNATDDLELLDEIFSLKEHPEVVLTMDKSEPDNSLFRTDPMAILRKPFDIDEVHRIIREYISLRRWRSISQRMDMMEASSNTRRLKFSTRKGYVFLSPKEIVFCRAESNYTHIILSSGKKIIVSKSLHHFDNQVISPNCIRISRSAIINTEYLSELNRKDKTCVLHVGNETYSLPVTRKHVKHLLDHYCNCYSLNN